MSGDKELNSGVCGRTQGMHCLALRSLFHFVQQLDSGTKFIAGVPRQSGVPARHLIDQFLRERA